MDLIRLLGWKRLVLIAVIVATISAPFLYSAIELARFERADARRATFVYASGQSLTPGVLIDAVLAAEDHRFFEHGGVDFRALLRAAWANLRAGRVKEGGSTITQQLVKVRLLNPQRTFFRKLREAWLAALVESRYSKERILEAYLNEIYLGQRGPIAIRGVGAATRAYFGKEVHQLTTPEAALIAAIIRGPNIYSPAVDPDRAREHRNTVLAQMRDLKMITPDEYERARRTPVRVRSLVSPGQSAPYFVDYVRQELEQRFDTGVARVRGVRIVTTLDLSLQRFAETAAARGLDRLESSMSPGYRRDPGRRLQVAMIVVEPSTGEIRALVGGRDYLTSQFNRVPSAHRQPGSAFKPIVYLAALRAGDGAPCFTAASRVEDLPITVESGGQPWSPRNSDDRYEGIVTVRQALEQSLNSATVRIAQTVGLPTVIEMARALGIPGPLAPVPAMALGAFEVTPLELARAYLPLANCGAPPGTT